MTIDKHLKGLYGNIAAVLISENSLSSEIVSDILYLQIGILVTLKIMTKILLIQD